MPLRFFKKSKKMLDISAECAIIQKLSEQRTKYGGIAQLGERLNGIQEVSGSIPLISTNSNRKVGLFSFGTILAPDSGQDEPSAAAFYLQKVQTMV